MLDRNQWLPLARKLDWEYSYVREEDVFPEVISGSPWLSHSEWKNWDEPYKTTYTEYVLNQQDKDASVYAVRDAVGKLGNLVRLPCPWINAIKVHAATLPLAEFAAVIGELRGARFGRDSAWRTMAVLGALDEFRHTQIPLLIMHELIRWDPQFDWTHKFYHSNNWVAIAGRHLLDELLLSSNAIEFAIATNVVFETGFTNLQFIGLSSFANQVGDFMFEKMVKSIQTDEARHAQIGLAVLPTIIENDPEYAQQLLDKWFWRNWLLFSIISGFAMDYLTPLKERPFSFKEFMEEWIIAQYLRTIRDFGMKKPWYWNIFLQSLEFYHHMVYVSAYTYRSTVWFNFAVPGPKEQAWLRKKYPKSWDQMAPIWEQIIKRWKEAKPNNNEMSVHGTAMVTFCDLCQLVLCGGSPLKNTANTLEFKGQKYIFCSKPCRWIFEKEPERYSAHKGLVKRILTGEAPREFPDLLANYFRLTPETWGKDIYGGNYSWMKKRKE